MERIILTETNFSRLKELVKKNKGNEIIFTSNDDELNRKVMEKLSVAGVMIPLEERKDYTKQRSSGLNEVMSRIMKKAKMVVYIDFDEVIDSKNKERIFARLKQNIDLCNREKVQMKFVLGKIKREPHEIKSFFSSLGAPTWMVKNSL
ncbi:MAG: hypothetical protein PF542_04800 [Nanoarchaeota archaeon]|jgi:RNase P/RNase MRP subunit p30|nr:hypothetical protein [Nanoarchaeota archaeon]